MEVIRNKMSTKTKSTNAYVILPTPVGRLTLVATPIGLAAVLWQDDDARRVSLDRGMPTANGMGCGISSEILQMAMQQLAEYFDGSRKQFDLPLDFHGTIFQKSVWAALLGIPYGETRTYAQIAIEIGKPNATRAVGAANGKNPLSIIVPCHRVIGSSGGLTGFAGGLGIKRQLLDLEGAI
jgi:methylated-DNA-[protein]-cysteine S-methyltransferase